MYVDYPNTRKFYMYAQSSIQMQHLYDDTSISIHKKEEKCTHIHIQYESDWADLVPNVCVYASTGNH